MNTSLLIDGTNLFMRAYIVSPQLDKNGNPLGGTIGFLKSLRYIIDITAPQSVYIVFDGQGGSQRRRKIYSEYKSHRKPLRINRNYEYDNKDIDQNKQYQFTRLLHYLDDLPVRKIIVDYVEADDVIAFLAKYLDDDRKVLVSDDKDYFALLSANTIVFRPTSKMFYNNKSLQEEFNCHPCNFALLKSLAGDKSDNIKGIQGIGFKTAIKYFPFLSENKQFTVDDIIKYAELQMSNDNKKYEKFISCRDILNCNFQVIQLYDSIISANNMTAIKERISSPVGLGLTNFRIKLIQDGVSDINDTYFQVFKGLVK